MVSVFFDYYYDENLKMEVLPTESLFSLENHA